MLEALTRDNGSEPLSRHVTQPDRADGRDGQFVCYFVGRYELNVAVWTTYYLLPRRPHGEGLHRL
jgi:hypothetical protein